MIQIFRIAFRNLMRYKRRTLLTSLLITLGLLMVILFSGLAGSFKTMMVGQITDSNLAQMQIHKKGYVSSIDTMPLHLSLNSKEFTTIEKILTRIKLSAMLSNFVDTTNVRLNAIDPQREITVCPDVMERMKFSSNKAPDVFLSEGEVIIPQNLASGMNIKIGDTVVLVANNKDGSVNGLNFTVKGIIESVLGPQGKEGYMHINDARSLLRMEEPEVIEVAIRAKKFDKLGAVYEDIGSALAAYKNKKDKPVFEIHTWEELSPFSNISRMIDLMAITMKLIMIAIVLISILNVMIMSVYERVREIGTMSAIGTSPGKIMGLFLAEGFSLGIMSVLAGNVIGIIGIYMLNIYKISFSFGRMNNLLLSPSISLSELAWVSAIVLMVSVFASIQPAHKASKMEPVDALGHI